MSSLVGSEMCIRDSSFPLKLKLVQKYSQSSAVLQRFKANGESLGAFHFPCLLYTSDAADDM
eukprot:12277728-Prorocentrum_lima.AAC.1